MRNWNAEPPGISPTYNSPFLAYLWGIETVEVDGYKVGGFMFLAYLWGIETGAADPDMARNPLVFSLPMRNWNREKRSWLYSWCRVFSLPMRNWNREHANPKVNGSLFLAYLWGIEPPAMNLKQIRLERFLAYLWGIETWTDRNSRLRVVEFLAYLWGIETHMFFVLKVYSI